VLELLFSSLWQDEFIALCGEVNWLRSKASERPKLGPLVPVIDAILEADKTAPPKQRHTAKWIFERLRIEHGFLGGYTVVKDYVRLARNRSREVFVPPVHPPGHGQVDFGECIGVIGGRRNLSGNGKGEEGEIGTNGGTTRLQDATTSAPKTLAKLGVVADARSDQISKRAPVFALYPYFSPPATRSQ
jgi:hypothetical protein